MSGYAGTRAAGIPSSQGEWPYRVDGVAARAICGILRANIPAGHHANRDPGKRRRRRLLRRAARGGRRRRGLHRARRAPGGAAEPRAAHRQPARPPPSSDASRPPTTRPRSVPWISCSSPSSCTTPSRRSRMLPPLLGPHTLVVPLQNGVDSVNVLTKRRGPRPCGRGHRLRLGRHRRARRHPAHGDEPAHLRPPGSDSTPILEELLTLAKAARASTPRSATRSWWTSGRSSSGSRRSAA